MTWNTIKDMVTDKWHYAQKWSGDVCSEVPIFVQLCRTIVQWLKKFICKEDTADEKERIIILQKQTLKVQIVACVCVVVLSLVVLRGCGDKVHPRYGIIQADVTTADADESYSMAEKRQVTDEVKTEATMRSNRLYCVIDLSEGANATNYPLTYLDAEPRNGWSDEYKTEKLVLRLIEPGTFVMGHLAESNNKPHDVTLTKPYYIGVFEITQMQYELVTGGDHYEEFQRRDSLGTKPVAKISYDLIRGRSEDSKWLNSQDDIPTASSFIGKLRTRTGMDFDLPTEAQWEYACRAGTTTKYYWGNSMDEDYAWFYPEECTHPVGEKKPNSWGLYDMSGNVAEWCLDKYSSMDEYSSLTPGTYRVFRGGSYRNIDRHCTSSFRSCSDPSMGFKLTNFDIFILGFRIAVVLSSNEGN